MATNPNGIFSAALAAGPHVEPFDVGQYMDRRALAQSQNTAIQVQAQEAQQNAQRIALENQKSQRDLELDQQRRQAAKDYATTVPSTPPPAGFPAPPVVGSDDEGHPIYDPNWHQAAASASNPVPHFDWDGYSVKLLSLGDPEGAKTAAATARALREKDTENAKNELANMQAKNAQAGQMLGGLLQTAQPNWAKGDASVDANGLAQAEAAYQKVKPQLEQLGVKTEDHFDPAWAAPAHAALVGQDHLIDQHNAILTGEHTEAATAEAKATTEKTTEETKMYRLSNAAAEEFIKNPGAVLGTGGMIERLGLDPSTTMRLKNQIYGLWQMPGTPTDKQKAVNAAIQKAVDDANQTEATVRRETDPRVIKAHTDQAVTTAVATERAKAALAPGAVAGINDPVLQRKAIDDFSKADSEYRGKEGDAARLQAFVDAARSGNQAAATMIPIAEVREIVNRVNSQELKAAGGVSALRQVQNWLSGKVEGKPSEATLNDVEQLGGLMLDAAKTTYRGKTTSLNTTLGSKFPTEPTASARTAAATPKTSSYKAGDTRVVNGVTYKRDNSGTWHPQPQQP
jgi:hypothetical protein